MNDILIPLGKGSRYNNEELKYCLRSLEKYVSFRNVVIVGERPEWLNDESIHIPCPDPYQNAARNIMHKVVTACEWQGLSDEFLFINDDYFFTRPIDPDTYPYYHKVSLTDTLKINQGEYRRHSEETLKELQKRGLPIWNFDTHYPIRMDKQKLIEVVGQYSWQRAHGLILKSTYCNTLKIEGEFRLDCKAYNRRPLKWWEDFTKGKEVFSIANPCLANEGLREYLRLNYPEKSSFEK